MTKANEKTEVKIHYVCIGCRMVSDKPAKCSTPGCPRGRNGLFECDCTDNKHQKVPRVDAGGYAIKIDD